MKSKNHLIQSFTKMASRYEKIVDSELKDFWGWSYRGVIESLFDNISIEDNDTLLDIATGTGVIPARLVQDGISAGRIHGLDITWAMLERAQQRLNDTHDQYPINWTCASAMEMPYADESFTIAICGLATHHMSVEKLVSEIHRILMKGGALAIVDAGGMGYWKIPGVKFLLKIAAFIYFSITDHLSRAWSEAEAVSNVRSNDEWFSLLKKNGFTDISIVRLKSKNSWISTPLIIQAVNT